MILRIFSGVADKVECAVLEEAKQKIKTSMKKKLPRPQELSFYLNNSQSLWNSLLALKDVVGVLTKLPQKNTYRIARNYFNKKNLLKLQQQQQLIKKHKTKTIITSRQRKSNNRNHQKEKKKPNQQEIIQLKRKQLEK